MPEFSGGTVGYGSGMVTAASWVAAVAWVQSRAQELPGAAGTAKKKKKKKEKIKGKKR